MSVDNAVNINLCRLKGIRGNFLFGFKSVWIKVIDGTINHSINQLRNIRQRTKHICMGHVYRNGEFESRIINTRHSKIREWKCLTLRRIQNKRTCIRTFQFYTFFNYNVRCVYFLSIEPFRNIKTFLTNNFYRSTIHLLSPRPISASQFWYQNRIKHVQTFTYTHTHTHRRVCRDSWLSTYPINMMTTGFRYPGE